MPGGEAKAGFLLGYEELLEALVDREPEGRLVVRVQHHHVVAVLLLVLIGELERGLDVDAVVVGVAVDVVAELLARQQVQRDVEPVAPTPGVLLMNSRA